MPTLLELSRELVAMAQAGLTYTNDPFDRERFTRLHTIASELLQTSNLKCPDFAWPQELGYPTPKVDVRGAIFKNDQILLVKERMSKKWTLPGGWADVNATPRNNVERECLEETGFQVEAQKLISIIEMECAGYPKSAHCIYKLFFLCDIVGGMPLSNIEISDIAFYSMDDLPELDVRRTSKEDLLRAYEHFSNPQLPAYFN